MLTSDHDKMRISVVILNFEHASQRSDGFEVLDVLPRGPMDLKFGHTSQRFDGLKFGHAFQRSDDLNLDVLPRGSLKLNLDVLPRGPTDLKFGRAS